MNQNLLISVPLAAREVSHTADNSEHCHEGLAYVGSSPRVEQGPDPGVIEQSGPNQASGKRESDMQVDAFTRKHARPDGPER